MKESKLKQLRDFIKSHEIRYFVEYSEYSKQTHIKKAYKVEINNYEYWVHFRYGDSPVIKDERILLKTMDEAKAKAQEWRDKHQQEKKEADAKRKKRMEDVVKFLNDFSWYVYQDWNTHRVKPNGQPFAEAIKKVYEDMPSQEKEDKQTYINLLENYIKNDTIYTQAISFRKEHVVSVKYGESGAVQIELVNGTTIIPKSTSVSNLIRTIFGDALDGWSYKYVKVPTGENDKVEES